MLRERTVGQARTITDLYYQEIMDNIAMHAANPEALPYFSYPGTGGNSVQRTIAGFYQPAWNLVNYATLGAATAYHYLFNQQTAQVNPSSQNIETWNTQPTSDPDKIQLMKFAYEKAFGVIEPGHDNALRALLYEQNSDDRIEALGPTSVKTAQYGGLYPKVKLDYYSKVYPGWFSVGSKCDVPKEACYVGHCGKTYAWVMPTQTRDLANFTLAILDIATYQSAAARMAISPSYGIGIAPPPPK